MLAREPHYFVYIFGEQPHEELEIGMSGNLHQLTDSKTTAAPGVGTPPPVKLVYYEHYQEKGEAMTREKHLKEESKDATIELIESMNPNWLDLSDTLDD